MESLKPASPTASAGESSYLEPGASPSLDGALLIAGLRKLYKALRDRHRAAESEGARSAYRESMEMIEQMVEEQDRRRKAFLALATAVAREVGALLDRRE